ncbi:uncharacterized protein LOC127858338 isoform X1 [Dreissena polymorpha]|uniref:uncharacterized protein LOC127858338 isoform X1 n=1 Tax=Dreissena polymorpha TaxID=45954 RepID=UPI002263ABEB|nr:uncharacterized protein LOC127858338 isoform X1 [Dreissena polymorpha]
MAGYKDIANDRSTSQGPLLRYINATVVNSSSVNYGPTTESVLPVASNDKAQDVVAFGAIALIMYIVIFVALHYLFKRFCKGQKVIGSQRQINAGLLQSHAEKFKTDDNPTSEIEQL